MAAGSPRRSAPKRLGMGGWDCEGNKRSSVGGNRLVLGRLIQKTLLANRLVQSKADVQL